MSKVFNYYSPTSKMKGPIALTISNLEKNENFLKRGVYLLADKSNQKGEKRMVVKYVGRGILVSRLVIKVDIYGYFYYVFKQDPDDAFLKECGMSWDGTYKGEQLKSAVFIVTVDVEFTNGYLINRKQRLLLIR